MHQSCETTNHLIQQLVHGAGLHWYALADAAQSARLPETLGDQNHARSLFGASWDSPLGRQSPWLISIPQPDKSSAVWRWIGREAPLQPAALTIFASHLAADEQLQQLQRCLDLKLPDGDDMVLGFWDPVILATLVGQIDDLTLHVPGPVLSSAQQCVLMQGIVSWWYWDREGGIHRITPPANAASASDKQVDGALPLTFTQSQVDDIVEASVPDQVLYHVQLNQPLLLEPIPLKDRYAVIRNLVRQGRSYGLETFRDLTNFCCAGLIYGARMQTDPVILRLLESLKSGERRWDDLVPEFPE